MTPKRGLGPLKSMALVNHFSKGLTAAPLTIPSHESDDEIDSEDPQMFGRWDLEKRKSLLK